MWLLKSYFEKNYVVKFKCKHELNFKKPLTNLKISKQTTFSIINMQLYNSKTELRKLWSIWKFLKLF